MAREEQRMALAADSIRPLTRAFLGARLYQGLLFWLVLVQNVNAVLKDVADPSPRLRVWLTLGAILTAATIGTYYRWRFGRAEPPRPSPWERPFQSFRYGVVEATALGLLVYAIVWFGSVEAGARPMDLILAMFSGDTAMSLAASRPDRRVQVMAALAYVVLLGMLLVPALRPFQVVGHLGMVAALIVTAMQLHLFVVRGFRHAHV